MNPTIEQLGERKFRVSIDEREMLAYLYKKGVSRGDSIPADTLADAEWALNARKASRAQSAVKVISDKTNIGAFLAPLKTRILAVAFKPKGAKAKKYSRFGQRYVDYRVGFTITFMKPSHAVLFKLKYVGADLD